MAGLVTAQHTHPVVVAHLEWFHLLPVVAHKAKAEVAVHVLLQLLEGLQRVHLSPALDVLWLRAEIATCSPDLVIGLHVTPSDVG